MKFTTAEVLSAHTGRLFCQIDRVHVILDFLTRDSLCTHQLPRAMRACHEPLRQQLPWLSGVNPDAITSENFAHTLGLYIKEHGPEHELQPLPAGTWEHKNPFTELDEILSKKEAS